MEQQSSHTADRQISVTRTLNAPVEQVWAAWTDPLQIIHWWGPDGFTNTIHKMDVEAGGEWRLTMHGPDGKNYANRSEFVEIAPMKKIIFQHFNPHYLATITFTASENKTLLEWTMLFETAELFETVVKVFRADKGLEENAEKLSVYLEKQVSR